MTILTKKQRVNKLLALQELNKRKLAKKPEYTPNPGQLPVHQSEAQERWVMSANGTGKTTALVQEVYWAATGYNPITKTRTKIPCKIVVVLDKSDKVKEVFQPEWRKWFDTPEENWKRAGKTYDSELYFDNGSKISFYTAESDPMSFEGFMADYVFIDEPLPKPLVTALRRSLRIKGSPSRLTYFGTAVTQAWIRREVWEPWTKGELKGVECFKVGIEANRKNLADGYIERFSQGLSDAEKEVRLNGGWFDADALALAHLWDRSKHLIPFQDYKHDKNAPCVVAIDNHSTKPHTAILVTCDREDNLIVVKEFRLRGNAQQFAEGLIEWMKGFNVIEIVCDSLGSMEMSSGEGMHSFIEGMNTYLKKFGISVRPTRFKEKNHEDLVDRLRQALTIPLEPDQYGRFTPKMRVLSNLNSLINDIENATWQKNRQTAETIPKIETSIRDHLSCLGYALATHLFYDKLNRGKPTYQDAVAGRIGGREAAEGRSEVRQQIIEQRKERSRARRGLSLNRKIRRHVGNTI